MGVGSGAGVLWPPGFENFSKKGCFLSFEWEKQISPLLATPRKILEKSPVVAPPEKILPMPMKAIRTPAQLYKKTRSCRNHLVL